MKILMIAQSSYDIDARIRRFTSALRDHNIKVDIICMRYYDQSVYDEINGIKVFRIMKSFSQETILSYIFGSILFLLSALIKTVSLGLKNRYDLVHVHNMPDYLVFSTFFLKLKGIPVILDIHDLTVELFKEKWSEQKFTRFKPVLIFAEKISCCFANHVITVTKACADILIERGIPEKKISLIMNSADENLFNFSPDRFLKNRNGVFRFLYHGTVAPRFGLHYFIQAMPKILKAVPGAEFHIYGKYSKNYKDELKTLVLKLNIAKSVIFNPHIPYNEVNEMIKNYDIGVITYQHSEYMNLALPTKACEYALTGLPVIISDMNSVRTVFSDKSFCYIKPDDSENIINNIVELCNDNNKRKSMAISARDEMMRISWNVMKNRYLELVKTISESRK